MAAVLFGGELETLDEPSLLDAFAGAPSTVLGRSRLDEGCVLLVDLLCETGVTASKSRARTMLEQGGVYVNNRRERDAERCIGRDDLVAARYLVIRKGKADYHLVRFD